jgi:cobalt/nickel transport protein
MKNSGLLILGGLLLCSALALGISPWASSSPDGLEKVAQDQKFLDKGEGEPFLNSPLPDYLFPGIINQQLAAGLAGLIGLAGAFCAAYGLALLLRKKDTLAKKR